SHGQLLGLARDLAKALPHDPDRPASRLAAQVLDDTTYKHLEAAVTLRNAVVKKGALDDAAELKQAAMAAGRQMLFLGERPLVPVRSTKSRGGANVLEVRCLCGVDEANEARVETDLALAVDGVYLLDPMSRTALRMSPLYIAGIAWLSRTGSAPEYESGDG